MNDFNYDVEQRRLNATNYLSKVFSWMFLGLIVTALASFITLKLPFNVLYMLFSRPVRLILIFAEFGLVMFLSARITKMSYGTSIFAFLFYAFLNGVTLSVLTLIYDPHIIMYSFSFTALAFGVMSVYGIVTKTDLTKIGQFMRMAIIVLIVVGIVNWFLKSSSLYWFVTYLGVILFLGLTAYDTQKIKNIGARLTGSGKEQNIAIICALTLYLDFINLFLFILRLFGKKR